MIIVNPFEREFIKSFSIQYLYSWIDAKDRVGFVFTWSFVVYNENKEARKIIENIYVYAFEIASFGMFKALEKAVMAMFQQHGFWYFVHEDIREIIQIFEGTLEGKRFIDEAKRTL